MSSKRNNIKNFTFQKLSEEISRLGLKKYASKQIFQWLFKKGASSFDEMTNLSKGDRELLKAKFYVPKMTLKDELADDDGTKKFLYELEDGELIESVLIPAEDGRRTLCISSQVGCKMGCVYCRTAGMGFVRNLAVSEIVDQVLMAGKISKAAIPAQAGIHIKYPDPYSYGDEMQITNIVLMGMGEPLSNYENVAGAISILRDDNGPSFSARRITLSTSGIVSGIKRMAHDGLGVKLAVSLNATTDETRKLLMPHAAAYTIDKIVDACKLYHPAGGRFRTTFEYVLINGINDSMDDAKRLVTLMRSLPSKVNLIPFNSFDGCKYKEPQEKVLKLFYKYLYDKGIQVNTRKSRGQKILAACGQLAVPGRRAS